MRVRAGKTGLISICLLLVLTICGGVLSGCGPVAGTSDGATDDQRGGTPSVTVTLPPSPSMVTLPPLRIDIDTLKSSLRSLTDATYAGRQVGSEGNRAAATALAERFRSLGLVSPAGIAGYLQPYRQPVRFDRQAPGLTLLTAAGVVVRRFTYLNDFALQAAWSGMRLSGEAQGILTVCRDLDHPDKAAINGRMVLVPASVFAASGGEPQAIVDLGYHCGARGVVLERAQDPSRDYFPKSAAVPPGTTAAAGGPFVFYASPTAFAQLQAAVAGGGLLRMTADSTLATVDATNVIALLPGADPQLKDRPIIVSAHFDHLGPTGDGGHYPGAVDNASGTVVMLAVAEYLAKAAVTPRRPVMFIAFNGEEQGLYGSRHYAAHPLFPLKETPFVNVDMVGGDNGADLRLLALDERPATRELQAALAAAAGAAGITTANGLSNIGYDHVGIAEQRGLAVTLNDNDFDNYHTVRDDVANVSCERLAVIIELVVRYLVGVAY